MWRYPLALLALTLVVYFLTVARSKNLIEPSGVIIGHDYFAFYMAGDMVRTGQSANLYNIAAQQKYQQDFMRPINPKWTGTCLYLNPPHYAWLMSWLSRWGYGPSLLIWTIIAVASFTATVFLWRQWIPPADFPLVVLLAACTPSWFQALAGGQNSFFSLLILTGFCYLLLADRDFRAGIILSLLAFKFQLLIIPILVLAVKRRGRALAGIAIGSAAIFAFTYLVMGPQIIRDYLTFASSLGNLMQNKGFDAFKQHSWHGLVQLLGSGWLAPGVIRVLTAIFSIGTLILLVPIFRTPWNSQSADFPLQLAALITATLVTSPHLFHYDMLLLTLPAVLWFRTYRLQPSPAFDDAIKAILTAEFAWLLISAPATQHLRVQLSPILLTLLLLALSRRFATKEICIAST